MKAHTRSPKKRLLIGIILVSAVILLIVFLPRIFSLTESLRYPRAYDDIIVQTARTYDLPVNFIYAVIDVESHFDEKATSPVGACGLMQLMPDTFAWLAGKCGMKTDSLDIYDPQTNITIGCYYLRFLCDRFPSLAEVCAAYNAGHGTVSQWLEDEALTDENGHLLLEKIPYTETRRHVEKVRTAYAHYQKQNPLENERNFDAYTPLE